MPEGRDPASLALSQATPPPRRNPADAAAAFARGDFHAAARSADACWQKYAGLGMLGIAGPALEGLARFPDACAAFYRAATLWIAGEDAEALGILRRLNLPEARALAALVEKEVIHVLAQLPYHRGGPQVLLEGIAADTKFRVANHTFHPDDRPSRPGASVFDWYRGEATPDFYVCNMLEWHFPPADIHEAPFPIFAQTSDTDLHIQLLRRWLPSFDAMFVSDSTEHAMVARLLPEGAVAASPSPFGWATTADFAAVRGADRPIDVFMSGIMLRPFYPDKARFLVKLLKEKDLNLFVIEGAVNRRQYLEIMAHSKTTLSYTRNQGAMVTRGIDALGMGCVPVVARDNVIKLSMPEECGFEYAEDFSDVVGVVRAAIAAFDRSDPTERASAARRIFARERTASRYMRALAVHAALASVRPRRRRFEPLRDVRRNAQFIMWPIPYEPAAREFFAHNVRTFRRRLKARWSAEAANNLAREYILQCAEAVRRNEPDRKAARLRCALRILEMAITREPRRLVLWLNFIRAAHFLGEDRLRARAKAKLAELLARDEAFWTVSVHDDVMPPDYSDNLLDRYAYFAALVRVPAGQDAAEAGIEPELRRCILASLHWLAGWIFATDEYFASAYRLNPDYGVIALDLAIAELRRDGAPSDAAVAALRTLLHNSHLFHQAACLVLAHRERLVGRVGRGEIETCRRLARVFADRVIPIESFNYTRGIGRFHRIGRRAAGAWPSAHKAGDRRVGLLLCEFEPPAFAPDWTIRALERLPFASRVRAAAFFHPGLSLDPAPWRCIVGNGLRVEFQELQAEGIAALPTDTAVVVYDPAAWLRHFGERWLRRLVEWRGGEAIVMAAPDARGVAKIVGVAGAQRILLRLGGHGGAAGTEGLFDRYEIVRRLRESGIPFTLMQPGNSAAAELAIPSRAALLSANRRYYAEIIRRMAAAAPPASTTGAGLLAARPLGAVARALRSLAYAYGYGIYRVRRRLLAPSVRSLFDADWYLKRYPDVAASGLAPFDHYRRIGVRERRDPHPLFDTAWYLAQRPGLAAADPLRHFIRYGAFNGLSPNALFDVTWYLANNRDVSDAGLNPLDHYIRRGAAEGRAPCPEFDTDWYRSQYPDAAASGMNPLAHYLHVGAALGYCRSARQFGAANELSSI